MNWTPEQCTETVDQKLAKLEERAVSLVAEAAGILGYVDALRMGEKITAEKHNATYTRVRHIRQFFEQVVA